MYLAHYISSMLYIVIKDSLTSVPRQNSGHLRSPQLPLQGRYPAQQTYLQFTQSEAIFMLEVCLCIYMHIFGNYT